MWDKLCIRLLQWWTSYCFAYNKRDPIWFRVRVATYPPLLADLFCALYISPSWMGTQTREKMSTLHTQRWTSWMFLWLLSILCSIHSIQEQWELKKSENLKWRLPWYTCCLQVYCKRNLLTVTVSQQSYLGNNQSRSWPPWGLKQISAKQRGPLPNELNHKHLQ